MLRSVPEARARFAERLAREIEAFVEMPQIETAARRDVVRLSKERGLREFLQERLRFGEHLRWIFVLIQSQKGGALVWVADLISYCSGLAIRRRYDCVNVLRPRGRHREKYEHQNDQEENP